MLIEIIVDNDFAQYEGKTSPVNDNGRKEAFHRKRKFKTRLREGGEVRLRDIIPIDESETSLCVALWRSVITQALYDITGKGGTAENKILRAEAYSWFHETRSDGMETDFEYVCNLALLESCKVLKLVRDVKEKGEEILDGGSSFRFVRRNYASRQASRNAKFV